MDIAAIAAKAFPPALLIVMVAIGLGTKPREAFYLLGQPALLLRAWIAIFVTVPAMILLLTYFAPMPEPAEAALIALSVSPMLPVLPKQLVKAGVENRLAVSLEVLTVAMALAMAPLVFAFVSEVTGYVLDISLGKLLAAMAMGVLLPLVIGIAINALLPDLAERWANGIFQIAMLVLVVAMLATLWQTRSFVTANFSWPVLAAAALLIVFGLLSGHLLGASDKGLQIALAQTAASRHPGFAIATGAAVAPRSVAAVVAVVVVYFLLRAILAGVYSRLTGGVADVRLANDR